MFFRHTKIHNQTHKLLYSFVSCTFFGLPFEGKTISIYKTGNGLKSSLC